MSGRSSFEETNSHVVVWFLIELQGPAVLHVLLKFRRVVLAQLCKRDSQFRFFDGFILFIFVLAWKSLPWERSLEQIQDHMANAL